MPVVGAIAAAGSQAYTAHEAGKAASEQASALKFQAKVQQDIARMSRKTEHEQYLSYLYTAPAERGKTIMMIGVAGLILVVMMAIKK